MFFIFDADLPKKIAEALDLLEQGNKRSILKARVCHITKLTLANSPDEDNIELVGKNRGILITHDKGFKTNKHRYKLYKQHYIGVIVYHSFKDVIHYWDIVVAFIVKWEELKIEITNVQKPFLYEINIHGFKPINIDEKGKSK